MAVANRFSVPGFATAAYKVLSQIDLAESLFGLSRGTFMRKF
jgi:hypothetical protein